MQYPILTKNLLWPIMLIVCLLAIILEHYLWWLYDVCIVACVVLVLVLLYKGIIAVKHMWIVFVFGTILLLSLCLDNMLEGKHFAHLQSDMYLTMFCLMGIILATPIALLHRTN